MPRITGPAFIAGCDVYNSDSVISPNLELGQRIKGSNGAEFRYVKAGATALVVGNVIQSPAYGTDHNALVVAATDAGSSSVVVTLATSGVTANQYKGGTLTVNTTPGLGETYIIKGHAAQATVTGTVKIFLEGPIRTSATRVALRKNPCDGVIASPVTTLTGSIVGVAIYPIPASSFGFIQTQGPCAALSDNSSIIMGSDVEVSLSVASSIALGGTAGVPRIGRAMQAKDNGKCIPVDLML
jgi:hypothetical protein